MMNLYVLTGDKDSEEALERLRERTPYFWMNWVCPRNNRYKTYLERAAGITVFPTLEDENGILYEGLHAIKVLLNTREW